MNTAIRPLELRLTSERDVAGTRRLEKESRTAVIGQLRTLHIRSRRTLWIVVIPFVILATAAAGFAVSQ